MLLSTCDTWALCERQKEEKVRSNYHRKVLKTLVLCSAKISRSELTQQLHVYATIFPLMEFSLPQ